MKIKLHTPLEPPACLHLPCLIIKVLIIIITPIILLIALIMIITTEVTLVLL